jgi:hypothetical protein
MDHMTVTQICLLTFPFEEAVDDGYEIRDQLPAKALNSKMAAGYPAAISICVPERTCCGKLPGRFCRLG